MARKHRDLDAPRTPGIGPQSINPAIYAWRACNVLAREAAGLEPLAYPVEILEGDAHMPLWQPKPSTYIAARRATALAAARAALPAPVATIVEEPEPSIEAIDEELERRGVFAPSKPQTTTPIDTRPRKTTKRGGVRKKAPMPPPGTPPEPGDPPVNAVTMYVGPLCPSGHRVRYRSNNACVTCLKAHVRASEKNRRERLAAGESGT